MPRCMHPRRAFAAFLATFALLGILACTKSSADEHRSPGSFTLSVSPSTLNLSPGASQTFQVQRVPRDGFNQTVSVSFTGVPQGVTFSPSTLSLSNDAPASVSVSANGTVEEGDVQVLCAGSAGSITNQKPLQLSISIGSYALELSSASVQLTPGASKQIQIHRVSSGGFAHDVDVSFSGAPQGVTFTPSTLTLSSDDPVSVTVAADANTPEADVEITCSGSYLSRTVTRALQVAVTFNNSTFIPTTHGLPVMYLTTTGGAPVVSKDEYLTGHMSLDPGGANAYEGDIQIKGRGNSTWMHPKKPYRIKLNSKAPLFGFPTSKDWALLANYSDKTLLRNTVALELSRRLGLPYTTRTQPVEVYLNGEYEGAYQLIESIKIDANRVNITKMAATDTTGDALTGGYLMEIDQRRDQPVHFDTAHGVAISFQDPELPTPEQLAYFQGYIQDFETALFGSDFADSSTGYAAYIDADTFLNWYLVNEIFSNVDSYFFSSCWLYKDRLGKLCMGPAWDFDLGAGNVDYPNPGPSAQDPTIWWTRRSPWHTRLFEDPAFAQKAKDRWNALKATQIDTLLAYIDQNATAMNQAQQNNFQRWPILGVYVWPNPVIPGTYAGEVTQLKTWLTRRIEWMDAAFN